MPPWSRKREKVGNSSKQQTVQAKDDKLPLSVKLAQGALQEAADALKNKILETDPHATVDVTKASEMEAKIEGLLKSKQFDDSKKSIAQNFVQWVRKILPIVQSGFNSASVLDTL
jgi:hypothetical protein